MTGSERRPDFGTLVDWIESRLDAESAARVSEAVAAGDPRTTAAVAWLRAFMDVASMDAARMEPPDRPPPIVRQNLLRHFA